MYHIPTAFFIIGFLYIFLPIVVWLVLQHQATRVVRLWCLGGGILAVGLLLIAGRQALPHWLTYTVANALAWVGILTQATGLRYALRLPGRVARSAVLVSVWILVFEYFRVVMQSAEFRFAWAIMLYVLAFYYIAYLGWKISNAHELQSGRWLSFAYVLAGTALLIRACLAVLGLTHPDVVAGGFDSILTVISGLLISVIGSFAFVSMFIERSAKRELQEVQRVARQAENLRFGEQIAQLERQRTLGAMSYSFAHELSQPLTAILMDTQAIKTSLQSPEKNFKDIANSVADVERSATRTVELIDRIRNFIRPTHGHHEWVDMKTLVRDVEQLLAHDIRKHDVNFEWDFDDAECSVNGDKVQLSQIILNVYRNALQAMMGERVRTIYVTVERNGDHVIVRVKDSGPGLDESKKEQFGHPFVTTKEDGLGVGLSISNTIAEMHGGSLRITNAVGGGALVELSLPAFNQAASLNV